MDSALILQAIESAAVVIGVVFGLAQLRQFRIDREAQAGAELLNPLKVPATAALIIRLAELPEGQSGAQLRRRLGEDFEEALTVLGYFESLGPLIARGHVPIDMFADIYRGPAVITWTSLRRYVVDQRAAGWTNLYEWAEWLADQMTRHGLKERPPAFEQFADWRSPADFARLTTRP